MLVEQHVFRFEIAVDDAVIVGEGNALGDGQQQGGGLLLRRQALVADQPLEAAALDVSHGVEVIPLMFANLEDGNNVGMIQGGRRPGLAVEALDAAVGAQVVRQDHLEGDGTVEADSMSPIDDAHTAAGNLIEQFVVAEAGRQWRRGRPGLPGKLGIGRSAGGLPGRERRVLASGTVALFGAAEKAGKGPRERVRCPLSGLDVGGASQWLGHGWPAFHNRERRTSGSRTPLAGVRGIVLLRPFRKKRGADVLRTPAPAPTPAPNQHQGGRGRSPPNSSGNHARRGRSGCRCVTALCGGG